MNNNEFDKESRIKLSLIAMLYVMSFMIWMISHNANASSDPQLKLIKSNDCIKIDPAFIKIRELYNSKPWIKFHNDDKERLKRELDSNPELKINFT